MTFLGTEQIKNLIRDGLIKNYIDLDIQLGPDGFDLTVEKIYKEKPSEPAPLIGFFSNERYVPKGKEIPLEEIGYNYLKMTYGKERIIPPDPYTGIREGWILKQGSYTITFNEELYFPQNLCGVSIQRSSLPRSHIETNTGKWNGGYHGKGTNLLTIKCPEYVILKNARLVEINFIPIMGANVPYHGSWQHENVDTPKFMEKNR